MPEQLVINDDLATFEQHYCKFMEVTVYTDGSCHSQTKTGAWVAILLYKTSKTVISGKEENTTHNRMELTAVIKAIEYIRDHPAELNSDRVIIYSDSQYVTGLPARKEKLTTADFITKKGIELNNTDLLKKMSGYLNSNQIVLEKVKAHQKRTSEINYNTEADILSRKLVRES